MSSKENGREPRHPIRVVSERTGLSPDVLRAWEKRYGAVAPPRREGAGQRLYSDADVERLRLLRRATAAGRSIGHVAALSDRELEQLVREDEAQRAVPSAAAPQQGGGAAAAHVRIAMAAAREMDGPALEAALRRALVLGGAETFIDDVAPPFLRAVGDAWEDGSLTVAHEHLASAVMRRVLGIVAEAGPAAGAAPVVVVATPAGQVHELGAMLAAASAMSAGWRVVYLGADLPADEVARAARETGAEAVALSIVLGDGRAAADEVRALRRALPPHVPVIAGGAGARAVASSIGEAGLRVLPDFAEFRRVLTAMAVRGNNRAK
ncbi:MerR family transcriptional regulator [Longimicrobium sp.]|uniref:MerR family transcriptional regulator n=1 Tax=Longimicrobium sp. TaxID=2029185 RepID=UPI002C286A41|nr:cobalamin-dependent protein [Longimicrobium sp.]HSU15622.1 cobalamin-dependent protein [Longimicrobium sp.]